MCGITGYSGKGDNAVLNRMNEALRHRGPDDGGLKIMGETGLAMRRLSIIDISMAGHQPMSNKDGTITIVFNGEIYNFAELRKTIESKYKWTGNSDTEVILHLYEEMGTEAFNRIQGMFAIAIYDLRIKNLILARDRMGKKPLFWSNQDGSFMFGSELKALMEHPSFKKEIDLESVNKYFAFEYIPTPHTIFKNTFKLEPGTYLTWDGSATQKYQYWKPTFEPKQRDFRQAYRELDKSLELAVKNRLVSDVPLGIFLSGGIDSSTIAYYASRLSSSRIKTFSIGFKEKSYDESAYARQVADYLKTDHHEQILSVNECLTIIPKIAESLDEPIADASIVPTYLLSKFTREHVTVALGGDGGDELFFGYDTVLAHKLARIYSVIPRPIRIKVIRPIINLLPSSSKNMSLDFRLKKFVNGFEGNPVYRNQRWLGAFDETEIKKLLKNPAANIYEDLDQYSTNDNFDTLAYQYERTYMMDQILVKVDRASMMNSLEVRAPFLDTRVVDLANHMPTDFKLNGLKRKFILKQLMHNKLPHNIVYRRKKGFGMPITEWLRGDLKPLVDDYLSDVSLNEIGIFNNEYVAELVNAHQSGKKDNRKQIWTLLMFSMWWRMWMGRKISV